MKYVYLFGSHITEGSAKLSDILGGKGANLAEMSDLNIPVPPGFTISTSVCNLFLKEKKINQKIITKIEKALGIIEKKSNIKVIGGEFFDFIEKSDLLIGSASTTCMESIALGIPVAIIGVKNKILQNPIPSSIPSNLWRICYTVEELKIFIKILVNKEGIEYSHQNDDIKSSYFIEPNRENVEQLFDLKN